MRLEWMQAETQFIDTFKKTTEFDGYLQSLHV